MSAVQARILAVMTQVWTSWTGCEWPETKFYWASNGGVHAIPPYLNPLKGKDLCD